MAADEVERDRAAERMAQEVHARGRVRQRLDPREDRVREEADAVFDALADGLVAPPVPEEVEGDGAALARKERERERPLRAVRADPVQEDERRRAAGARGAGLERADGEAAGNPKGVKLQYFLINPTTTPWTFTSPSEA
jgi:hypothetical protein